MGKLMILFLIGYQKTSTNSTYKQEAINLKSQNIFKLRKIKKQNLFILKFKILQKRKNKTLKMS